MNFGEALQAIKEGKCACRAGWNGKRMFVFQGLPRVEINRTVNGDYSGESFVTAVDAADHFGIYYSGPVLCMKTAQDTIVVGWLASQTDMLAEDWEIFD
jgi:hypothetical protein